MSAPSVSGERRRGRVFRYDEDAGLGWVEAVEDGSKYRFHCTQIADGSRRVDVGAEVGFVVIPGRLGQWEAGDLRPAGKARG
jgi:cold shock CspA family protein